MKRFCPGAPQESPRMELGDWLAGKKGACQENFTLADKKEMLELSHSIKINSSPDAVFDWFGDLPVHYRSWHPDHVTARWIKKVEQGVGTVFYAEQKLDGDRGGYIFTVTEYVPGRLIVYKPSFPRSLNLIRGSFIVEPVEGGCLFTATLRFRFGFLVSETLKRDIEIHIGEEGENLKKLLESKRTPKMKPRLEAEATAA